MYKLSSALIFAFAIFAKAGPNSNAALYINFGTDTAKIDSVTYRSVADTFTAAVQINKAISLYAFEFLVGFDTSALQFISGSKELIAHKNILETQKGTLSLFKCGYSRTDSTKISVGVALQGSNEEECPDGSGFLAFLKFCKKNNDTTKLNILSPVLIDFDQVDDDAITAFAGTIYPGSSAIIKRNQVQPHFSIHKAGGIVTIYSPEIIPQSIQLFTIDGRCLTKIPGTSRKTSISLPSVIGNVPCIVRVQSRDNYVSSLMINN